MDRWRSRCAERGLRQAGCVSVRPAAGCLRLQSFVCCGPTSPQIWPGLSSAGLEARRAGRDGINGVRLRVVNLHSARSSVLSGRRGGDDIRFMAGAAGGQRPIVWVSWLSDCDAPIPPIDDFGPAVVFQAAFVTSRALFSALDQQHAV